MTVNQAKAKLDAGEVTIGTLSLVPEPALAEIAGGAGYDFFVVDTEHVAVDGRTVETMIRACEASGTAAFVRVRHAEEKTLLWTLDAGAQGIMIPLVTSAEVAQSAAELCKFPPVGRRTLCSASRAAGHGLYRPDLTEYFAERNANTLVIGLIETPDGVAGIADIARTDIDVLMVGRADLSLAMGLGYAPGHPDVVAVAEQAMREVVDAGAVAGVLAYSVEEAHRWIDLGCRFIVYSQPEMILSDHYRDALGQLTRTRSGATRGADSHHRTD